MRKLKHCAVRRQSPPSIDSDGNSLLEGAVAVRLHGRARRQPHHRPAFCQQSFVAVRLAAPRGIDPLIAAVWQDVRGRMSFRVVGRGGPTPRWPAGSMTTRIADLDGATGRQIPLLFQASLPMSSTDSPRSLLFDSCSPERRPDGGRFSLLCCLQFAVTRCQMLGGGGSSSSKRRIVDSAERIDRVIGGFEPRSSVAEPASRVHARGSDPLLGECVVSVSHVTFYFARAVANRSP
jgi:hypothetical protein